MTPAPEREWHEVTVEAERWRLALIPQHLERALGLVGPLPLFAGLSKRERADAEQAFRDIRAALAEARRVLRDAERARLGGRDG